MKKILLKILEPIVLVGVVVFLGFVFIIEVIDLFLIRPIYQKLFKKKIPGDILEKIGKPTPPKGESLPLIECDLTKYEIN